MPHPAALAVLAGLLSGALFVSLLTGFPVVVMLAYFVQLPLLFVGLSVGVAGSVIAGASGVVVVGLIAPLMAAALYGLAQALPAVFVVRQMLLSRQSNGQVEWYPPGLLLAQLTGFAALALALAWFALLGQPGGLQGTVEAFLRAALEGFGQAEQEVPPAEFGRWLFLFPGFVGASWVVMVVVNAVLAQAFAVRMGWHRRPTPDFSDLELPWWLWPLIGVAAFLSLLGDGGLGFLGRAMLIVLVVPYVFLGLAVLHALAHRWSHPMLALIAIYGSIVLFGWPILLVLLLGFIEDWAGLRRRFT
jgi:hypothetical protein